MPSYNLIVFDIAGTTVKDPGNVARAFMDAFRLQGIEVSEPEVNVVMGFRKIEAIERVLEDRGIIYAADLVERIHASFDQQMISFYEQTADLEPLPGVSELFDACRNNGVHVALNTGFTRDITDTILRRLNWNNDPRISMVVCSDEVPEGRPSADMIGKIMHTLGIEDPSTIVKVGDTEVDVLEGRNASCGKVISVTTGAYTREQLEQYRPDHIIDHMQELSSIIELN